MITFRDWWMAWRLRDWELLGLLVAHVFRRTFLWPCSRLWSRFGLRLFLWRCDLDHRLTRFRMRRTLRRLQAEGFVVTPQFLHLIDQCLGLDADADDDAAVRNGDKALLQVIDQIEEFHRCQSHGEETSETSSEPQSETESAR